MNDNNKHIGSININNNDKRYNTSNCLYNQINDNTQLQY